MKERLMHLVNRDFEDKASCGEIIRKKDKLMKILEADEDLKDILGKKPKKVLTPRERKNLSEEEIKQKEIEYEAYNHKINSKQIINYLKLTDLQSEVLNFVMFDIADDNVSYDNEIIKKQMLTVICLVHEDDMDTEYDINRADLLAAIIEDLITESSVLGTRLKKIYDKARIFDTHYYGREMQWMMLTPSMQPGGRPLANRYDRV